MPSSMFDRVRSTALISSTTTTTIATTSTTNITFTNVIINRTTVSINSNNNAHNPNVFKNYKGNANQSSLCSISIKFSILKKLNFI